MGKLIKCVMATNLAVIVLQACVLGFQIYRWNEIVGSVFSIVISFLGYLPTSIGESRERWFIAFYAFLLLVDLVFQLVNMILLICLQWVVIQFCIHLNVSVDISDYGGVACNDWWHFGRYQYPKLWELFVRNISKANNWPHPKSHKGYGEINYRDRALIVTILLAIIVILRLIQVIMSLASLRRRSIKPAFFMTQDAFVQQGRSSRLGQQTTLAWQVAARKREKDDYLGKNEKSIYSRRLRLAAQFSRRRWQIDWTCANRNIKGVTVAQANCKQFLCCLGISQGLRKRMKLFSVHLLLSTFSVDWESGSVLLGLPNIKWPAAVARLNKRTAMWERRLLIIAVSRLRRKLC